MGVRPRVWLVAVALAGAAAALLGRGFGSVSPAGGHASARPPVERPEAAAVRSEGRGTRILVGQREVFRSARPQVGDARGLLRGAGPIQGSGGPGRRERASGSVAAPPADSPALAPAAARPAELVSLERDALRSLSALERDDAAAVEASLEPELAALEQAPGETPRDFADRVEDTRGRLVADELLLRARLADLYSQQVYPHGFPVEHLIVSVERQLLRALPAEDRAALLRRVAEGGAPPRPAPSFHPPESGLVYDGGPGL